MLFWIMLGLVLLISVAVAATERKKGPGVVLLTGGATLLFTGALAFMVFLLAAVIIDGARDVETEWGTTSEVTYTVAELSDVTVNNNFVNFFTEEGGKLDEIEIPGVDSLKTEPGNGDKTTVTVSYQHREKGTAIVPWGEGEERTVVVVAVKN